MNGDGKSPASRIGGTRYRPNETARLTLAVNSGGTTALIVPDEQRFLFARETNVKKEVWRWR